MSSGPWQKTSRINQLDSWIAAGLSASTMARKLQVSPQTLSRYLRIRKDAITRELGNQQFVLRQRLISASLADSRRLEKLLQELDNAPKPQPHAVAACVQARTAVHRNLAKLVGAETPSKHLHLHAQQNGNGSAAPMTVQAGNIQVIFEDYPCPPGFVPGHRLGKPIDVEAEKVRE